MSDSFACPDFHRAISRRHALKVGGLGLLGLNFPRILNAEAILGKPDKIKARAKSVIFLFQWGGPSHIDMFDMKPGAPEGIRGPHKPISSKADGILSGCAIRWIFSQVTRRWWTGWRRMAGRCRRRCRIRTRSAMAR